MNKLLSIHIPTYNRPKRLKRTLESVIPQAEKYSVPIYISDDSTNSESQNIVNKLTYKHLFYTKTEKKFSRHFFKTIKKSNSKFSWSLADDDSILSDSIQLLLEVIDSNPKLEFISINALVDYNKLKRYLPIKNNLYYINCIDFFPKFYNKTHFSTYIVNTKMFNDVDTAKYNNTWHRHQGEAWEYLAVQYKKRTKNNIIVIGKPLVILDVTDRNWDDNLLAYIELYDRFYWLNLLPELYKSPVEHIKKDLLQQRSTFKQLLRYKKSNSLKFSRINYLFYYFPKKIKIKAKMVSVLPAIVMRIILKFNQILSLILNNPRRNFLKFLSNLKKRI